ncbi:hypothetical protein [Myxococcus sp. AB036A]|uniref:hypothetical protein n=1 Tax=Myxococcus sp. AB036A TaxID=2562793 RepID=UPI001890BEAF|nr:hypothetical protein [Myxococcus sp. AB036A]
MEAKDTNLKGWIYAFLKSPQGFAMMSGSQYASVIRHIEPHHVAEQPIPLVDEKTAKSFAERVERIVELRNEAIGLTNDAERLFADAIGEPKPKASEHAFVVSASKAFGGRRRLEASYYSPTAEAVFKRFKDWEPLSAVTERIWWMTRFKRIYGEGGGNEGFPYMSADELFSIDPPTLKRVLIDSGDNYDDYFVKRGWILMACSGQVYGLNGAARLVTAHHERIFFSHDLIRIIANEKKIRPGYLVTALTHPTYGRPLLIRAAYGTSIPHLDPGDVSGFPVARLGEKLEAQIADQAEKAAQALADADALDRELAADAGELIDDFLA